MKRKTVNIYYIKKNDENEYFLKPGMDPKNIVDQKMETVVNYGEKMSAKSIDSLKEDFYKYADEASRIWIDDQKLIPRFIFSAFTAAAIVVILTFVIRDPIPLADELLAGSIAGVVLNLYLKKRYRKTVPAIRKRLELRAKAESLNYQQAPFILELQKYLSGIEGLDSKAAAENITAARAAAGKIPEEHRITILEILKKEIQYKKIIRKAEKPEINKDKICQILELCEKRNIDKNMAALYLLLV